MATEELEQLAVTVPKAAASVDVSRSTGYAYVASGEWPSIRVGRSVRVPVEALRAWVERRTLSGDPTRDTASEAVTPRLRRTRSSKPLHPPQEHAP